MYSVESYGIWYCRKPELTKISPRQSEGVLVVVHNGPKMEENKEGVKIQKFKR